MGAGLALGLDRAEPVVRGRGWAVGGGVCGVQALTWTNWAPQRATWSLPQAGQVGRA